MNTAEMLARAFQDDPPFAWIFPDPNTRPKHLAWHFRHQLEAAARHRGRVAIAENGACISYPPNTYPRPWWSILSMSGALLELPWSSIVRGLAVQTMIDRRHLKEPHYYVALLGVEPERQGEGIGRSLLNEVCKAADQEQLPTYLETGTQKNVQYYERFGFRTLDEVTTRGSPPIWLMLRNSQS